MKLFLFEFATCGDKIEDNIAVEGLAMFKAAIESFKKYYEIHSFVREEYSDTFQLPSGNLELIERYLSESDAFLIIAPEDDNLLLDLTKIGEKYAHNLGSSSKAIAITSDKWTTYKKLRNKVNVPKTSKKPLDCKFIIKPRVSCAGEGIEWGCKIVPDGHIAQEYIEGQNLSVSIIVEDVAKVVSVNEQILDGFRYVGAIVPARIDENVAEEVKEEALKAVECIDGLNGYVGVDVVYSDQAYVIEVNARLTTPVAAFERAYGIGIAEMLKGHERKFVKRHMIRKGKNLKNCYVSSGDQSLQIVEI